MIRPVIILCAILTALLVSEVKVRFKAKAALNVSPRGGQIVVFTLVFISALAFFVAVWLHVQDKNYVLPLVGAIVFLSVGGLFWWVSHKNEELKQSHPFSLNVGKVDKSLLLSADVRSLPQVEYIKDVLSHYSSIFHREPLPMADGIIDKNGSPLENSVAAANVIVTKANECAREQCEFLVKELLVNAESQSYTQSSVVSTLPSEA